MSDPTGIVSDEAWDDGYGHGYKHGRQDAYDALLVLLPVGPRPGVDLHSIGAWDLAQQLRAVVAADPSEAAWSADPTSGDPTPHPTPQRPPDRPTGPLMG